MKILRFKVRSTKMKVNNENGSDVSSDKTAENAVIVGRKKKDKKGLSIPKFWLNL